MSFSSLGLSKWILQQLEVAGVTQPTPIQHACIPEILSGRDCLGVAQTGSGKTLAFALPILQALSEDPYGIFALVLTPTRELAGQIADQFRLVGKKISLRDCLVVGGRDMVTQGKELASHPHVVVATPGRLADHLNSCNTFSLRRVRYLVLDEADRMFDGSFDQQLQQILSVLPSKKRQTLLFTATISDTLSKLKEVAMNKPFIYEAAKSQVTVDQLDQRYVMTPREARDGYLVRTLQVLRDKKAAKGLAIVFVRTVKECEVLSMCLGELGFPNASLHSGKTTAERSAALSAFRSRRTLTLVATDVAGRGLDVPEVEFVINHNVPTAARDYIHRVGRTARAGRGGVAVTLVTPHDVKLVKAIEERIGVKLQEFEAASSLDEDVAEILTQVKVTRQEQEIKLSEQDFEERREINRRKKLISRGIDPDEEARRLEKERKRRRKELDKERKKRRSRQEGETNKV